MNSTVTCGEIVTNFRPDMQQRRAQFRLRRVVGEGKGGGRQGWGESGGGTEARKQARLKFPASPS